MLYYAAKDIFTKETVYWIDYLRITEIRDGWDLLGELDLTPTSAGLLSTAYSHLICLRLAGNWYLVIIWYQYMNKVTCGSKQTRNYYWRFYKNIYFKTYSKIKSLFSHFLCWGQMEICCQSPLVYWKIGPNSQLVYITIPLLTSIELLYASLHQLRPWTSSFLQCIKTNTCFHKSICTFKFENWKSPQGFKISVSTLERYKRDSRYIILHS